MLSSYDLVVTRFSLLYTNYCIIPDSPRPFESRKQQGFEVMLTLLRWLIAYTALPFNRVETQVRHSPLTMTQSLRRPRWGLPWRAVHHLVAKSVSHTQSDSKRVSATEWSDNCYTWQRKNCLAVKTQGQIDRRTVSVPGEDMVPVT
ncbi:hypothetical protein J6590_022435 [Homalodisca vitripennis]|nr:hypothetical protein J6590_022435 [Homalodisca vitripennis]